MLPKKLIYFSLTFLLFLPTFGFAKKTANPITSASLSSNYSYSHYLSSHSSVHQSYYNHAYLSSPTPLYIPRSGDEDKPNKFEEKIVPGTQKGVYLTGYSMGTAKKREEIYKLIDETELNCIVFNAKDDSGYIDYDTNIKLAIESKAKNVLYDIDEILKEMNERNIYSIARVVVFKDSVVPKAHPELAIKDSRNGKPLNSEGSNWPDIYCETYWDYIIEIVKELAQKGVDEVQFDYIRGPAKGNITFAQYSYNTDNNSKSWALQNFLKKVTDAVKEYNIKISADVFGFVLIENNDQGIGQLIEDIEPYVDYLYPMPYPSHYSKGFLGYSLPEEHPYEVVKYTLEKGLARIDQTNCIMMPWIQAFGLKMSYTKDDILAQIKAAEDLGINGFLFWNAANKYGVVREALVERYKLSEKPK